MSRQPWKWVRLKTDSSLTKTNTRRAGEWNSEAVFFLARREMASTKSPARSEIWADICSTLIIVSDRKSLGIAAVNLFDNFLPFDNILPFDRKRYLEATNDCTWRLTRHNVFDTNWHGWNGAAVFFINEKYGFTKTFSADADTISYFPHSISSKRQSKEKNVRMTFKWHICLVIDCWSLTAPIRNSVRGRTKFCKITMTSGRRNLHLPTPNPLLIFDRRPPPWYKFLSLPSLQLPLKSKMAAIIFVKEILSSRSPKSRLLCRLTIRRYWPLFFNYKWYIPFRKHPKWKLYFLVWIQTNTFSRSIDYYSWQVSWINFEVREKRFTKEFRAMLATSDFDIQLTWKDPENSGGIQGNSKTTPSHIIYFSFQKLRHTTVWRPLNWQPTGVDIFLSFTTFKWNREKKGRMDSS